MSTSPKVRRPYSRHGLEALKARVKVRGLSAIDRRTAAGRALIEWKRELLADLGGEEAVSAQKRAIVDLVVRTKLYVDSLDAWLMEQRTLVLARRKAVLPVLRERQALADSLARLLGQLGLKREDRPAVLDPHAYAAQKYGHREEPPTVSVGPLFVKEQDGPGRAIGAGDGVQDEDEEIARQDGTEALGAGAGEKDGNGGPAVG